MTLPVICLLIGLLLSSVVLMCYNIHLIGKLTRERARYDRYKTHVDSVRRDLRDTEKENILLVRRIGEIAEQHGYLSEHQACGAWTHDEYCCL
jgi:hypothetical protein